MSKGARSIGRSRRNRRARASTAKVSKRFPMPRPRKEPPSPSRLVPAVVRYARSRGVDVGLLVVRFGLPADVAQRDAVPVLSETPNELLAHVAGACGEPDVALRLGVTLHTSRSDLAELAARASATLRDALGRLARYAPLLHVDFDASLDEDGAEARWTLRTPARPRGVGRFVHELALAHGLAQCR